ncbi:Fe2+-enterobactin ABC transporter substrate-binding protein [Brachybacterium saurashtrense]|uniref:Fe2+-enterobactin ABC transporter substrate-binding protein n=1 Tax=Brachybacterium saurashtrense TaxID=556288 RepID=A0A345YQ49_9MICO|nr:Fe2+-enterobactin ABC transporter substrate-binding protein [Brachybacterium saurashtrense]AXK46051.1 Fe2+-enterobactin ABC transporter substrate-binding protein [Brachybacterium saurashtrense]RRR23791.1 Fe2+-enterobactin ABC transporter substrate-binding protein [Brachybacterium saurashtrense]
MTTHTPVRRRTLAAIGLALTAAFASTSCSAPAGEATAPEDSTTATGQWPRTVENADGTSTEIPRQPRRIVATSVSVTGTLLAMNAPVVASGSQVGGVWFDQWADIAEERGLTNLWSVGEFDLEAVMASDPDLIIVVTSGRGALTDQVTDLQSVAPTVVIDYGAQTWQELALELGRATGLETEAQRTIDEFDALVTDVAGAISVPEGTANIISFNGPGQDNPIARGGGSHADLLESLGFTLEDPDPSWHTQAQERADFVWATYENLLELTSETTFILSADDETAQGFAEDPVLANVPAVAAGQVYGLGRNSFRMDPYSSTEVVEHVRALFS